MCIWSARVKSRTKCARSSSRRADRRRKKPAPAGHPAPQFAHGTATSTRSLRRKPRGTALDRHQRTMRWRWALLGAACLVSAACHEPKLRAVRAVALFDKDDLDFGEVPVGEWREATVHISNVGYVPFRA